MRSGVTVFCTFGHCRCCQWKSLAQLEGFKLEYWVSDDNEQRVGTYPVPRSEVISRSEIKSRGGEIHGKIKKKVGPGYGEKGRRKGEELPVGLRRAAGARQMGVAAAQKPNQPTTSPNTKSSVSA